MKVGIIGVGLIGGSLALSAREHIPDVEIFGSNRSEVNLQKSLDLGLINFRLLIAQKRYLNPLLGGQLSDFENVFIMKVLKVFGTADNASICACYEQLGCYAETTCQCDTY